MTILEKKAEENYHTAVYAEKEKMFNVAISRYYYCALLSAKDYLVNKMMIPEDELKPYNSVSSHRMIILRIINSLANNSNINYFRYSHIITRFDELRDLRNCYEYDTNEFCDEITYTSEFKSMIEQFLIALKSVNVITLKEIK